MSKLLTLSLGTLVAAVAAAAVGLIAVGLGLGRALAMQCSRRGMGLLKSAIELSGPWPPLA